MTDQPTHAAVPLPVFSAMLDVIGSNLNWKLANPIMAELQKCPTITLNQQELPENGPPTDMPDGTVRSRLDSPTG